MAVTADSAPALLPPLLLLALLFLLSTAEHSSSQISPSPAPGVPTHISLAPSPLPMASSPFSAAPLPGNSMSSLASSSSAPAPLDPLASSLPSPAPLPGSPLPLMAPLSSSAPSLPPSSALPNDEIRTGAIETGEMVEADERGEGGSGNKKGIAVGVIAAALAWMGAAVYRKRRQNIRRARYGSATRREIPRG